MCKTFLRETEEELLPGLTYKVTYSFCRCYGDNIKYKAEAQSINKNINNYILNVWHNSFDFSACKKEMVRILKYRILTYKINTNIQTQLF